MSRKIVKYQKLIYISLIIIALGVTFSATLKESVGSLGTVLIAVGGLFLIMGMNEKKKNDELN